MSKGSLWFQSSIWPVGKILLLAAAIHTALYNLSFLTAVRAFFVKLAWALGPYRSLPICVDFEVLFDPGNVSVHVEYGPIVILLLHLTFAMMIVLVTLHAAIFWLTVAGYKTMGRPRYWNDVHPRLDYGELWVASVKRSWWIWPLGQAVWLLIDNLHWGFQYTQFPAIQNSAPFWFLNFLVIVAGITIQTSKVIRDAVLRTLRTDEIRCESCEYLLRGIDSDHCPECGTQRQPLNMLRYGVRFARGPRLSLKSQLVRIFLAAAMLMAPIWVPLTLSYTTLAVSPYVPEWMKPGWRVFMNDRNQIPVRYGLTYLIRHGKEVATLHAFAASPFRTRYEARYWKDGSQFATATPDTIESGQLKVGISAIEIGPWTFRGSPCQSMMWLTRPDDSFSVTGFEHEPR